ncbi:MAG: hypothetical protein WA821_20555, partial [Anaerolineales bacterium]
MKIKTPQKILLGIATVFYTSFPVMLLVFWLPILLSLQSSKTPTFPDPAFVQIFAISMCIFVPLQFVLLIFYLSHLFRNTFIPKDARI